MSVPPPPRALPLRHRSYGLRFPVRFAPRLMPLPLSSLLLRHLASFEESWQVVHCPCCPRELPDVISENLSLDAGSRTPAVYRVPQAKGESASRICPDKAGAQIHPAEQLSHRIRRGGSAGV